MKEKCLSLLLAVCLLTGLLPASAEAAGEGKALQKGAAHLQGGQVDMLWLGDYAQADSQGSTKEPVKWRILENADGKLILLLDKNLDAQLYHERMEPVTWETSSLRAWLNQDFYTNAFSSKEQALVAKTANENPNNPDFGTTGGNATTDKVFVLSIAEAENSSYFPNGDGDRIGTNTAYAAGKGLMPGGAADHWWLRSPGFYNTYAACVDPFGGVCRDGFNVDFRYVAVRPAFQLTLDAVLFSSAAAGGKASATSSGGSSGSTVYTLPEISAYTGNEWKLTVRDASHNGLQIEKTVRIDEDRLTIRYANAVSGDRLSALVEENGAYTHYGSLGEVASLGTQGEVTLDLAAIGMNTDSTGKALYLFNEEWNGDNRTDYAGELLTVIIPPLETVDAEVPTITGQPASAVYEVGEAMVAALRVQASVSDGGTLSYQWYTNDSSNTGGTEINGATESTYTPSVDTEGTVYYYCKVINTNNTVNGNQTAQAVSDTAEIVVSTIQTGYRAMLQTDGLQDAAAALSKTSGILAQEAITVTVTPNSGRIFEDAPLINAEGATVGAVAEEADGSYTCEISDFTQDAVITVTGETKADTTQGGADKPSGNKPKPQGSKEPLKQKEEKVHEHAFKWVVMKEPTIEQDGLEEYGCDCGEIKEKLFIPAGWVYVKELYGEIKNAPKDGSVTYDAKRNTCISDYIIRKLAERTDVETTIIFTYEEKEYGFTLPRGTDFTLLLTDEEYFYGYFTFCEKLGIPVWEAAPLQ